MTGRKKFLYWKNAKAVEVQNIQGLGIKQIIEFGREHWLIDLYLPIYKYYKSPSRDWIWNVINSLANEKSIEFISKAMKNREIHDNKNEIEGRRHFGDCKYF